MIAPAAICRVQTTPTSAMRRRPNHRIRRQPDGGAQSPIDPVKPRYGDTAPGLVPWREDG